MLNEQEQLIRLFFQIYIEPFIKSLLNNAQEEGRAVILALANAVSQEPLSSFTKLLDSCYPPNIQNEARENVRQTWLDIYHALQGTFSNRLAHPASNALNQLNNPNYFGKSAVLAGEFSMKLCAYFKDDLSIHRANDDIQQEKQTSLPIEFYQKAATGDLKGLHALFRKNPTADVNCPESVFGNSLLHLAFMRLGHLQRKPFKSEDLNATFSMIKYLLDDKSASTECINNRKLNPLESALYVITTINPLERSRDAEFYFMSALTSFKDHGGVIPCNVSQVDTVFEKTQYTYIPPKTSHVSALHIENGGPMQRVFG